MVLELRSRGDPSALPLAEVSITFAKSPGRLCLALTSAFYVLCFFSRPGMKFDGLSLSAESSSSSPPSFA